MYQQWTQVSHVEKNVTLAVRFHEAKIFRHPEQNFLIFPVKVPVCQERFRCLEHLKYRCSWISEYSIYSSNSRVVLKTGRLLRGPDTRKQWQGSAFPSPRAARLRGSSHTGLLQITRQAFSCLRAFVPAVPAAWKTSLPQSFLSLIILISQVLPQKSRCFP